MPSPIYHCTSIAELQALITRAVRAYPELEVRAAAAGGLIAADAVAPDPRYEVFLVDGPAFDSCRVDLLDGTCSCLDSGAPTIRNTKLCEHVLACLVVKHLAERAQQLLSFLPIPPRRPPRPKGFALFAHDDAWVGSPACDGVEGREDAPGAGRDEARDPFGAASRACEHARFVQTEGGTWCLVCDRALDDGPDYDPLRLYR